VVPPAREPVTSGDVGLFWSHKAVLVYIDQVPITPKLRCQPMAAPFRVVLVEPEIPPNTGSVARTCAATSSPLHLIAPLGFRIDDRSLKRAGIDYWHLVRVQVHPSLADYERQYAQSRLHLFSAEATRAYLDADFLPGDSLVFGRESVGLPRELLKSHSERVWGIPTSGQVRSLNLSNAVAIVLFEALRRNGGLAPAFVD
jgi:tRNA (cytidine/uridine-2'-O-)-methyltransferase